MSYARMDHAAWVESNNAAGNHIYAHRRNYVPVPEKLSDFQAKVADIVGMVFGGVYNAPINWSKVEWKYGGGVSFVLDGRRELSTFDFGYLTKFVFLCHAARIRGSIEPGGLHSLRLSFFPRSHDGETHGRHPNLDEAIEAFREYLPADHRIIYRVKPGLADEVAA